MDDEQLRALEAAARELRLRADDPAAADDVRAAAAAVFVERQATEARQLVVRCRDILLEGGIPPDTTVTVMVGSPLERPPIWDSARDPTLSYRGWACGPVDPLHPVGTQELILPTTADTMIGSQAGDAVGAGGDTIGPPTQTIAPPAEVTGSADGSLLDESLRGAGGDRTGHRLLSDGELATRLADCSLAYALTELLVANDLPWSSPTPPSDGLVGRLRTWWRSVVSS